MALKSTYLSDMQISVMKVLWCKGRATVTETQNELCNDKALAPTTVATMLKRLVDKKVVGFEKEGRQYIYFPLLSELEVQKSALSRMVEVLFDNKPAALVQQLLGQDNVDEEDLSKIEEILNKENNNE